MGCVLIIKNIKIRYTPKIWEAAAETTATVSNTGVQLTTVGVRLLQIPLFNLEDAAEWPATGLENQGTGNCKGSTPSSSSFHQKSKSKTSR